MHVHTLLQFIFDRCNKSFTFGFVDLLIPDLSLQPQFEIIGPAVKLICFSLKEPGITLGYSRACDRAFSMNENLPA